MSSFFTSGAVNVASIDRDKLPEGTYRIRLTDVADHIGAFSGSRTQFNFVVVAGPTAVGSTKSEIVSHTADAPWKAEKARGNIAANLGAFAGMTREMSGLKVNADFFVANTRTVQYANGGKDVASATRDATELPLVKAGAEAILVSKPYFDRKTGKRKLHPKTGQPSVVYDFYPLSSGLPVTEARAPQADEFVADDSSDDDLPPAPQVDALELALADGWRANGPTYFYKKGEPAQLKADALRAKYSA